ncbi:hypothetical protein JXL19_08605 [bacterium]|nr:hypothetical protein [bacterium]
MAFVFSFIILWRDTLKFKRNFKKDFPAWIIAIASLLFAFGRSRFLPPYNTKLYDILILFVGLTLIYRPSRIKGLLIFSSCLIAPVSLAELYGFVPGIYASAFLLTIGIVVGAVFPKLIPVIFTKRHVSFDIILCVLFAFIFGIFSFLMLRFSKGVLKNGRILFDVGHGTIESPVIDYNRHIDSSAEFGHAKLVRFLQSHNFHVDFVDDMTSNSLAESSILVLIMSSKPYTMDEIRKIKDFVSKGGGLLVIGDHTDISNCMSSLNPVIENFGMRLRFDTLWIQTNDRINLSYRHHPATFDIEKVNFSVGSSLDIKPPARPVILSRYATFSDLGDPENKTNAYLGNSKLDPWEKMNDLCLIGECLYGAGKVFVMGDSAYFQNTALYQNTAFAYRLFNWLNHRNGTCATGKIPLAITIVFMLAISVLIIYRRALASSFPSILLISLILSISLSGLYNLKQFPMPENLVNTILVDMSHQNEYTSYWINREKMDTSIDGLIGQIIRTGIFPVIDPKHPICFDKIQSHNAIFIICPNKHYRDKEIEAVAQFVENGGGLLLVEGSRKWAASYDLWERFGLVKDRYPLSADKPILSSLGLPLRLHYGKFQAQFIPHPVTAGVSTINMVNPCKVRGGYPIAFIDGNPVINFKEYGRGKIIAIGDDRFFANYVTEIETKIIDPDKIRLIWNIIDYIAY